MAVHEEGNLDSSNGSEGRSRSAAAAVVVAAALDMLGRDAVPAGEVQPGSSADGHSMSPRSWSEDSWDRRNGKGEAWDGDPTWPGIPPWSHHSLSASVEDVVVLIWEAHENGCV